MTLARPNRSPFRFARSRLPPAQLRRLRSLRHWSLKLRRRRLPQATAASEHEKLFALFKASDEASLQRNPLNAHLPRRPPLRRPLRRLYQRRILCRPSAPRRRPTWRRLRRSPRRSSTPTDQLAYDVFEFQTEGYAARAAARPAGADRGAPAEPFLRLSHLLPDLRQRAGRGAVQDVADYENNLKRHARIRDLHRPRRSAASAKACKAASSRPR